MKWLNTNSVHNAINILITLVAGGALAGFDWTLFGVGDSVALKITGGLALLKLIINAVRDGPAGMVAPPPPAEEK
ncbi:hypothetical protein CK227_10525 [Mesorhizobium sp. WSM4308]|uniref:hypothetical protein n=1 Tax=Mesorhizobium sp. WSM4308 TaxID=2029409 RepID=UPI000BAEF2EC|nr:hypothetical protein [Mesorhizobium sp. WSM4308]PBB75218.1 hypothetical protein CK227_10525 [Mesorhizobium sp. WSM4308]